MVRLPYRHFVTSWLPDDYFVMVKRDYRVLSSHSSYRYDILKKKKENVFSSHDKRKREILLILQTLQCCKLLLATLKAATANELNNQHWMEKLFEE